MTSEGLGEMLDSAYMCIRKFPLMSMGGRAEGLACADTKSKDPHRCEGGNIQEFPLTPMGVLAPG